MHARTPFGNPDGSRSDIQEVVSGFVTFDLPPFASGLGIRPDDLSVRVIVGAKGSGKTVYLRRLQASAAANESVYAGTVQQELPVTSNIVKFCQCFKRWELTEKCMQLWYCAIIRSLVTHLLHAKRLRPHLSDEQREELLGYPPEIVPRSRREVSIYSQVTEIITSHHTAKAYSRLFDHPAWAELQSTLGEIVQAIPPVYFFIDSVDEEYSSAPMYWMQVQQGLFFRTMRFLRDPHLGGRLHVIVCVRDHVLASVLRSEHQNRYRGERHITVLGWDYAAAEYFLSEKLARLGPDLLLRPPPPGGPVTVSHWLGVQEIENRGRRTREPVVPYLLRHTRLLPRDVVILGNALDEQVRVARQRGSHAVDPAVIRQCVHKVARTFGSEQLAICANQIASSGMPPDAAHRGYDDVYTGDTEYSRGLVEQLRDVIRFIGKDRFDEEERRLAADYAKELFGPESDAMSVLWQNRLLGHADRTPDGSQEVFFSELNADHFNLPLGKPEYFLHSCMIDAVEIKAVGDPVGHAEYLQTRVMAAPAAPGRAADGSDSSVKVVWEPTPPAGRPEATGTPPRLGRYRVDGVIGKGGMGVVYLAEDERLRRRVAIKVLPAIHSQDQDSAARFEREARVLAVLDHPSIAVVYSFEEDGDRRFFTMEYVEGRTLAGILEGGAMAVPETFECLGQVGDALAFAHAKGVIHRDLKPPNIIVRADGRTKVLDFGIAKILERFESQPHAGATHPTSSGILLGTPGYMSPEQLLLEPADEKTDIWAFGCCLYECLAGRPAFPGRNAAERLTATREREPDWDALPPLPEECLGALRRALRKDRRERPGSVGEILRAMGRRGFFNAENAEKKD